MCFLWRLSSAGAEEQLPAPEEWQCPSEGVTVFALLLPLHYTSWPHLAAQPLSASAFAAGALGPDRVGERGSSSGSVRC